ncbi:hypothetical protein [Micromonospora chersina]|uniref:hypothetical protein n=1 Tax=Micromonospora chersina TaxID=47854 RepID=UPI0033C58CE1
MPVITAFIVVVILAASISPVALMLVVLLTAWFTFGKRRGANSVSTSSIEGRQGCLALNHPHDRLEFDKLIDLAQRIDKNIPMLTGLVDRNEAGEALARALWQAAGLLGRRRKIYSVIDELSRHEVKRLGEGSRVARDLQAQQSAAEELLKDLRVDLDKLMANLTATAEAGDDFRREREALRAVERASQTLAELATSSHEGTSAAADRLAEETVTVVRAYRELNELYGGRF